MDAFLKNIAVNVIHLPLEYSKSKLAHRKGTRTIEGCTNPETPIIKMRRRWGAVTGNCAPNNMKKTHISQSCARRCSTASTYTAAPHRACCFMVAQL